jgi:hypothetical protein
MKSSLIKLTVWDTCFRRIRSRSPFPSFLQAIISTKVLSVRMMICTIHLFSLLSTLRTAEPEQANRSVENNVSLPFHHHYCWPFPLVLVNWVTEVANNNIDFCSSSRLNLQLGFLRWSMLHSPVQTHVAWTATMLSILFTDYFGYMSCVATHHPFWLLLW